MLFCLVNTNWVLFLNVILHVIQEKNCMWKLTMTYNFRLQEKTAVDPHLLGRILKVAATPELFCKVCPNFANVPVPSRDSQQVGLRFLICKSGPCGRVQRMINAGSSVDGISVTSKGLFCMKCPAKTRVFERVSWFRGELFFNIFEV